VAGTSMWAGDGVPLTSNAGGQAADDEDWERVVMVRPTTSLPTSLAKACGSYSGQGRAAGGTNADLPNQKRSQRLCRRRKEEEAAADIELMV
jgi:hypothetical protein